MNPNQIGTNPSTLLSTDACCGSRRDFLKVGLSSAVTLALFGQFPLARLAEAASRTGKAKACILLWLDGGPSQFETFDPKPGMTTGGPTRAIPTSVRGIDLPESLPRLGKQMKRFSLIRSMSTRQGEHDRARHLLHTGYELSPVVEYPGVGSVLSYRLGAGETGMPPAVVVGERAMGPGFLGNQYSPFLVSAPGLPLPDSTPPRGVSETRYRARQELATLADEMFLEGRRPRGPLDLADLRKRAERLTTSTSLTAFDLGGESEGIRKDYGENAFGQGCLVARRLIEQDVRFVEVTLGGWDTHQNNFEVTSRLCPALDGGFATLLADLDARGLLESTLVLCMGEFGRTPDINSTNGRDHYPFAWSLAIAGGGIQGGRGIGATDREGRQVVDRPVTVPELYATVYRAFGIQPDEALRTPDGRPISLTDHGKPIHELLA